MSDTFFVKKGEPTFISQGDAENLKKALDRLFPHADFTLIIINYTEDLSPEIKDIKRVVEFKISKATNHKQYRDLFNLLR